MSKASCIRCDEWSLLSNSQTLAMAKDTVIEYRRLANVLSSVFLTHWPEVCNLEMSGLESYFHDTKNSPNTIYGKWFSKNFYKFPCYLRRAATNAAMGAVSSFMARYQAWQKGDRRARDQRPPQWGGVSTWPVLYGGKGGTTTMIKHNGDIIQVKLLDKESGDWLWKSVSVVRRGKRHNTAGAIPLSPMLIMRGSRLSLGQPYNIKEHRLKHLPRDRVCSVDQGINTGAVCSIVDTSGTVIARKFISCSTHIDRRDKVLLQIREKARQTMGKGGELVKGFCRTLYSRAAGLNKHIACFISRQILRFAEAHHAGVIVFENLKQFRPKGGRKRSNLKAKFHGWLHRLLVQRTEQSAQELGLSVKFVHPRGTSSFAYDGSGKVSRDKTNYSQCQFQSGKRYNCDLSASYNIAARYLVRLLNRLKPVRGKSVGAKALPTAGPRVPVTLSSLWDSVETPTKAQRSLVVGAFIGTSKTPRQITKCL